MSIHEVAALGGTGGALLAILWIAFADARDANAALNDRPDEHSDWGGEENHAASLIYVGERDHG